MNGRYIALHKARKTGTNVVHTALALSSDGKNWVKLGALKVDDEPQPNYFLLSGSVSSGCSGPVFLGTRTTDVVKGAALKKHFAA